MSILGSLAARSAVSEIVGHLGATYLRFVGATNRFVSEPPDPFRQLGIDTPAVVAMWHGQHFLAHLARRRQDRVVSLVSRSRDGDLNASVLRRLGVRAIRGSGARGRKQRGGAAALRQMIAALANGESVVMTADVPKVSRICGTGIVTLARLSGRPILPIAVVTSRQVVFDSWDHASLGLPFGRGAIVYGDPIVVPDGQGPAELESSRRQVENKLNAVHRRAYELVGDDERDSPG